MPLVRRGEPERLEARKGAALQGRGQRVHAGGADARVLAQAERVHSAEGGAAAAGEGLREQREWRGEALSTVCEYRERIRSVSDLHARVTDAVGAQAELGEAGQLAGLK